MKNLTHLKIIRLPEVLSLVGISKSNLFLKIENKCFPKSCSLGERAIGWPEHEVKEVVAAIIAGESEEEVQNLVNSLLKTRNRSKY